MVIVIYLGILYTVYSINTCTVGYTQNRYIYRFLKVLLSHGNICYVKHIWEVSSQNI